MGRSAKANAISKRRRELREAYFPGQVAWETDKAFFQAPRTLSMLMTLISDKRISDKLDPRHVYMELWARHMGDGIIEMAQEEEHAFCAGYTGTSAVRRWRERMAVLANHGFITVHGSGIRRYHYVLLRPPHIVVEELRVKGLVPDQWYSAYRDLLLKLRDIDPSQFSGKAAPAPAKAGSSPFDSQDDDLPF